MASSRSASCPSATSPWSGTAPPRWPRSARRRPTTEMPSEDEDQGRNASDPANWAEEEVAGEHGTTVLGSSRADEAHPEISPQTPGGMRRKLSEEAAEGDGLADKAKRVAQELDRTFSGEYERREQGDPAPDEGSR